MFLILQIWVKFCFSPPNFKQMWFWSLKFKNVILAPQTQSNRNYKALSKEI